MTKQTPELRLTGQDGDEYAALADLFLDRGTDDGGPVSVRDPQGAPTPPEPAAVETRVEGIVIGHLPVMGSAWVREHARWVARGAGAPVALLRISGGHAALDVFATEEIASSLEPTADLAAGIERVRDTVGRWLVQTDTVAEPALRHTPGIDGLSLLSGADEAAVVAAYRTIKDMVTDGRSDIRVVITGADGETAARAAERIRDASKSFLHAEVAIERGSDRIGPGPSAAIFRGSTDLDLASAVSLLRLDTNAVSADCPALTKPEAATEAAAFVKHAAPASEPPPAPTPAPTPVAPEPEAQVDLPRQPVAERDEVSAVEQAPASPGTLPGMTAVLTRCPMHARVSLLADAAGGSHLVCRVRSARDADRSLGELQAAQAWLRAHAGMFRELKGMDVAPEAELHLVTPDATFTRHLLDADAHVHLVVPPSADERHIALN